MNEKMIQETYEERKGMSKPQLMLGAMFAVVLFVLLSKLGIGGAVGGALSGGVGFGLAMLIIRPSQTDEETNESGAATIDGIPRSEVKSNE